MTRGPHYQYNWGGITDSKPLLVQVWRPRWLGGKHRSLSLRMQMGLAHVTSFHDPCRPRPPPALSALSVIFGLSMALPLAPERGNGSVQSFTSPALRLTESIKKGQPPPPPPTPPPSPPPPPPPPPPLFFFFFFSSFFSFFSPSPVLWRDNYPFNNKRGVYPGGPS